MLLNILRRPRVHGEVQRFWTEQAAKADSQAKSKPLPGMLSTLGLSLSELLPILGW